MSMIISGYQGIGKSSASDPLEGIIDFESSLLKENGTSRTDSWATTYVRQAIALADQGFIPLVSSHKEVRDSLRDYAKERDNHVITIAPVPWLLSAWLDRLEKRYNEDQTREYYLVKIEANDIDNSNNLLEDYYIPIGYTTARIARENSQNMLRLLVHSMMFTI